MADELKLGKDDAERDGGNDYKKLYGDLRNYINDSREKYKSNLSQVKEQLEQVQLQRESLDKQEELLIVKKRKLEGAVEASDILLKSVLPSNNKK